LKFCAACSDAGDADDEITDLTQHIHSILYVSNDSSCQLCLPAAEQKSMHIGLLPAEVMQYIFKWVVSSDLDIYSLEQLACVCRGFYLCARDEELWRLVCLRIWGINCGSPAKFGSFRNMYIQRPHLRFNGCYISKCFYYRAGEKGLDNYYRPYHRVEYYRYVRFFPEGKVLMLTSPDSPYDVLPMLLLRGSTPQGLLAGYYKLTGDRVTMALKKVRPPTEYLPPMCRYRRLRTPAANNPDLGEQSFDAEFLMKSVRDHAHWQLVWTRYAVHTVNRSTRDENIAEFELSNKNYPPLLFSRVRSFTACPRAPLC
jgi:F-box protein 9